MNDIQSTGPRRTSTKALRVLLLVCAGALLINIFMLFDAVYSTHSTQVTRAADELKACDPQRNVTLPNTLQFILNAQCVMSNGPEIR